MSRRWALSLLCWTALLGGNAQRKTLADSFDGIYTGKRVLTEGDSSFCRSEDNVLITIKGSVLTFRDSNASDYTISFEPHPDGSFAELSGNIGGAVVAIHGRISGKVLEADVRGANCQYHWHAERPWRTVPC